MQSLADLVVAICLPFTPGVENSENRPVLQSTASPCWCLDLVEIANFRPHFMPKFGDMEPSRCAILEEYDGYYCSNAVGHGTSVKEQVSFPQTRFLHWFEPFRVDLDDNFKACCHFKVYWKKKIILHWLLTIYIGSQLTSLELVWHPHCWMQHALAGDTLIAKHKQYLITNMSRSLTTVWSLFRRDCKLTFHYTTEWPCCGIQGHSTSGTTSLLSRSKGTHQGCEISSTRTHSTW